MTTIETKGRTDCFLVLLVEAYVYKQGGKEDQLMPKHRAIHQKLLMFEGTAECHPGNASFAAIPAQLWCFGLGTLAWVSMFFETLALRQTMHTYKLWPHIVNATNSKQIHLAAACLNLAA